MASHTALVRQFHEAFDLPIERRPKKPTKKLSHLRFDLLEEELDELAAAEDARDLVAIADALADIVYVAIGTSVAYGIPFDEVFWAVHVSNMKKLGPDGKPIYKENGKVAKPEGWTPPDIAGVLGV